MASLAKLAPILGERREMGLRYFRANFGDVSLEFEKLPTRRWRVSRA